MSVKKHRTEKTDQKKKIYVTAVVANAAGEVFDLEGYAAVGMAGSSFTPLTREDTVNMAYGGELMMLPDRRPVLYNMHRNRIEILEENPYEPGEPVFPVAAFNSPGYVISHVSAYTENPDAGYLPLFSYGAVGWSRGKFRSAAIRVDRERRQDLRLMDPKAVAAGVRRMKEKMPGNRLRAHLEKCALTYGCPAAKNFFLGRCEAPLPTARSCNAKCLGCLSLQQDDRIPATQERISFTPSPEEIAEVALAHIQRVRRSVVSFGQGCEGDPLLAAEVIAPAIKMIRSATRSGTLNMNTNAGRPEILATLFDAGLDSIRVSLNSVREACYTAYFKPGGYGFSDVKKSVETALGRRKFVSINYLNCPGFTDTAEEVNALIAFIRKYPVNMIQWRNLNFDPVVYWKAMDTAAAQGESIGMKTLLGRVRTAFPNLIYGYFNPPKEKFNN
ncbi:MAG: radical SAM protein [Pseudomonadota bacterium]